MLATCHVDQGRCEGRVLLWDVLGRRSNWVDGKMCGPAIALDGFAGRVTALDAAPAPDGAGLLLAAACSDGSLRIYDLGDLGASAAALTGQEAVVPPPVVLFDASLAEDDGEGRCSSLPAWSAAALRDAVHGRAALRFSPGGARLAAAAGPALALFDVATGQRLHWLRSASSGTGEGGAAPVRSLEWVGAGHELLAAYEDGTVCLWRAGSDGGAA